jgi:hypothetical protein
LRGAPPTELTPGEKTAAVEPPKLWLPVIRAERKQALLELHRELAETWTQDLRGSLRQGDQIKLSAFTFESADQLAVEQARGDSATLFAAEGTRMAGCVLVNGPLTAYFARCGIRIDEPQGASTDLARLTRLETMVARQAMERLVNQLTECYGRAGIAHLKSTSRGEGLKGTPLFGSQDYLAVFRYAIGDPEQKLNMTVAVNIDLVDAIRGHRPVIRAPVGSARIERFAAAVPVRAIIVLGSWSVPLVELAVLKAGDEIIMPEGDDASLEVAGIPIRAMRIEVAGPTIRAHVRAV